MPLPLRVSLFTRSKHVRVGHLLIHRLVTNGSSPSSVFDKLVDSVSHITNPVSKEPLLPRPHIQGLRVVVRGRPKGEEMAIQDRQLAGVCPKKDVSMMMDYGACSRIGRSGVVGVKAWVCYGRIHEIAPPSKLEIGFPTDYLNSILHIHAPDSTHNHLSHQ